MVRVARALHAPPPLPLRAPGAGQAAALVGPVVAAAAAHVPTRRWSSCAATPGITIPQIAEKMGIEPNYLYRVMPRLLSDGQVKREGQGWHPAG